jgi:hypothetical protein
MNNQILFIKGPYRTGNEINKEDEPGQVPDQYVGTGYVPIT